MHKENQKMVNKAIISHCLDTMIIELKSLSEGAHVDSSLAALSIGFFMERSHRLSNFADDWTLFDELTEQYFFGKSVNEVFGKAYNSLHGVPVELS